jgi:chemotaxis protein methyltransferase CheR
MTNRDARGLPEAIRRALRFVKRDVLLGFALVPYGRCRQRALKRTCGRDDAHLYTTFYRSPGQLEALTGPVLSALVPGVVGAAGGAGEVRILVFASSTGAEAYTIASELMARAPGLRFRVRASDLHPHMVETARRATYARDDVHRGARVPDDFVARTFDVVDGAYVVKGAIRERVTFEQSDLTASDLSEVHPPADLVFAQNVLFHMPEGVARRVFASLVRLAKPGAFLFVDGMELHLREELIRLHRLTPLEYRVRDIHDHGRTHTPTDWWNYYWGAEPYFLLALNKAGRYATIFRTPPAPPRPGVDAAVPARSTGHVSSSATARGA